MEKSKASFNDVYDYDHVHSRNRKNMAHSAFAEGVRDFIIKLAAGSNKDLFGEGCVPVEEILIDNGRNFFPNKVNIKTER